MTATTHDTPTPAPSGPRGREWGAAPAPSRRRWPFAAERAALPALLAGTALLYLIGLSKSGWANQFYAAAAQAGSKNWKAFLFGSLDQSNYITVDKPPASLWIMDVSVKIFGVNSWAILVPQALEGVAAVALLYAAVNRVTESRAAGLLAGAALALTPVATLMFRFDNPDALLVLLMTAAGYATVRAIDAARPRWLVLAGMLFGLAFLTKMLQGLIVVPAFALAYLLAAPTTLRKRVLHLLAAAGALIVAAGWWVALVQLWPAGSRPYIGGSTNNSLLQLIFGYNGFGRLTGSNNNGTPGGNGGGGFSSGTTGLLRLFDTDMGTQISWLIPAALISIIAVGWQTRRRPRTDPLRAGLIIWGGWLLLTGAVFSFASGIIHPYYTVALAPAIAALVGIGVVQLWRARETEFARWMLAGLVGITAIWTYALLRRADWHPELRWLVVIAATFTVAVVIAGSRVKALVATPLIAATLLLAPAAYALKTAATAHTGALPTAGPATTPRPGGPAAFGGPGGPGGTGGFGGRMPQTGRLPTGQTPTGQLRTGQLPGGTTPAGRTGQPLTGGGMAGGLGGAASVSSELRKALQADATNYRWVAATTSSNEAGSLELATGEPVMAIGGFNGTDNAITLAQFKQLVVAGEIHYYIADGQGFLGSTQANTTAAYTILHWVESRFTATTIGSTTVYDLTTGS